MGRAIAQAADAFSGGRVLSLLEGGYHPQALGRSVAAYLEGLAGETPAGEVN
jgi:acetoin utilization deacetylase AcuC-like enzyme